MPRYLDAVVSCILTLWTGITCAQALPGAGNCLTFDGSSTYVNCGTGNRGITQRVTLEAWIRTTSFNNQWVAGKYSNQFAEEKGYCLATWNGTAILAGRAGHGDYYTSGFSTRRVDDGRWHHLAGVIDNNVWRIYVDGVLENSVTQNYTTASLTTSVPLLIGDYFDGQNRKFTGEIDEVRIWKVVRTESQIQEAMCHKFVTAPADLVAYYRLDENSGLTVRDAGTQPAPGNLHGFSGQPWHLSGAAIGDRSILAYRTSGWANTMLKINTLATDTLTALAFSANTRGAQLYLVDAPPNAAVPGNPTTTYGGVFTLSPSASYQVGLLSNPSCVRFYRRPDNTVLSWTVLALSQPSGALHTAADSYRGEYAWGNGSLAPPTITGDTLLCLGQAIRLIASAAGASSFQWSTGATGNTVMVDLPGTYTVQTISGDGCTASAAHTVRRGSDAPVFSLGHDTLICGPVNMVLKAPSGQNLTFRWSDGTMGASLPIRQVGTYILTVSGQCGPPQVDSIEVKSLLSVVSVPNIITPNADNLNDAFTVTESCGTGAWGLDIYNRWGRSVYTVEAYANDWTAPGLPAGLYYYLLRQPATARTFKGWVEVVR